MGVEAEFTAYFEARYAPVRRTAFLLCGDWHRADDLAQTAFVRLSSSWHRLRDPGALDAYVRTCLLRSFLTEERRVWRRAETVRPEMPEGSVPNDDAERVGLRLTVLRALREIPPRQRAVLVCRYYDDLDVAATAAVLGISAGAVKSQTARGLQALESALARLDLPSKERSGR